MRRRRVQTLTAHLNLPMLMVGGTLLLNLVLARLLTAADEEHVRIAGFELHGSCPVQQRYGVPCPFCGITRSVVLALHGEVTRAAHLNPAGAMFVLGALLVCGAVLLLAAFQCVASLDSANRLESGALMKYVNDKLALWFSLYAGLTVLVTTVHWLWRLRLI